MIAPSGTNSLLASLSRQDQALLRPKLERVPLRTGEVLIEPNTPIKHVYFVETGAVSARFAAALDVNIATGLIGYEGMVGLPLAMNDIETPFLMMVEYPGTALRMDAELLTEACETIKSLRNTMMRYASVFATQAAEATCANACFNINIGVARWLLMTHDRVVHSEFPITHDRLAVLLSVRRPGVTVALHVLEGEHLIRARRGRVEIRDRPGLERYAEGAYGRAESEHRRLIKPSAISEGAAPPTEAKTERLLIAA